MPASVRARIVVATLILAGAVVWSPFGWLGMLDRGVWPFRLRDDVIACWFLMGLCAGAAVGLATVRWWGRLLPFTIVIVVTLAALGSISQFSTQQGLMVSLLGLVLVLCLAGRAMFERFEARAPLPLDWTTSGMSVIRWALITNAAGLIHTINAVLYLAPLVEGSPLQTASPLLNCFGPPRFIPLGDFLLVAGIAVVLMAGLILLARQRTIGLFVTAAAALTETGLIVIAAFRNHGVRTNDLIAIVPGFILTWAALIVWSRPVLRVLRGR